MTSGDLAVGWFLCTRCAGCGAFPSWRRDEGVFRCDCATLLMPELVMLELAGQP